MISTEEDYSQWVGNTEIVEDGMGPATAQAAAATLDEDLTQFHEGAELPPLWHWFYFLPKAPQSQLGTDGHPQREGGSFLPPIPYPRRMFAGARVNWHKPLLLGQPARREAVIRKIAKKSGRSGSLAFVTVGYRFFQKKVVDKQCVPTGPHTESANYSTDDSPGDDLLCIEEEQDIVFREPGPPLSAPEAVELPALPADAWSRLVVPNTRLLFRFSALTFNAHRIHYDRPYAMGEEGYPGLVVHGPLTAVLLMQLVRENTSKKVVSFSFRGQAPLFDLAPFRLVALPSDGRVDLEAQGPDARTAMTATAELA